VVTYHGASINACRYPERFNAISIFSRLKGEWLGRAESRLCAFEFSRPQSMVIAPVSTVSTGSE
jgi:hypothetical protein